MNEAKHTPGPWAVRKAWHGDGKEVYPVRKASFGQPLEVAHVVSDYEECAANAHLIAAAPEVLRELRELAEKAHNVMDVPDSVWAVIAKAGGKA